MTYTILKRKWPRTRPVWIVMPFELAGLVPILVLFGLSQPDAWRTQMWQIGFNYQFNSNPLMQLYAMANYRPLPTVAFVWSQTQTNFNVAISVLTLFILLAKMIAYIMHVWWPLFALVVNVAMTALWTVSVYGQMGPDFADPRYPSPIAWYIRKSCSLAAPYGAERSCALAKASFGVSVYMLALFVFNLGLAIWAMWPRDGAEDRDDEDEDEEKQDTTNWEMHSMKSPGIPPTPGRSVPYTPRTMAFHTLDRKLPLRYE